MIFALHTRCTRRIPPDQFAMFFSIPEELQSLPDYKAYVRTLIENGDGVGQPTGPHLVSTYPPFPKTTRNADRENVIETSTRGWTRPRAELEAQLARALKRIFNGTQPPAPRESRPSRRFSSGPNPR